MRATGSAMRKCRIETRQCGCVGGIAWGATWLLTTYLGAYAWIGIGLLAAPGLAQRSLNDHVAPIAAAGDRTRATYPALALMVEHRRVEALGDALRPAWLAAALAD